MIERLKRLEKSSFFIKNSGRLERIKKFTSDEKKQFFSITGINSHFRKGYTPDELIAYIEGLSDEKWKETIDVIEMRTLADHLHAVGESKNWIKVWGEFKGGVISKEDFNKRASAIFKKVREYEEQLKEQRRGKLWKGI